LENVRIVHAWQLAMWVIKWNIIVDSAYKYTSCNAIWNCWAYNKDWYNDNSLDIAPLSSATVTKTAAYMNAGVQMWVNTYTKSITCNATWTDYTEWTETQSLSCISPAYESDWAWGCKAAWLTLFASAEYNTAWDLDMKKETWWNINMSGNSIIWNTCFPNTKNNPNNWFVNNDCESWWWTLSNNEMAFYNTTNSYINSNTYRNLFNNKFWYNLGNSYFNYNWHKWIMLDNKDHDDYLKYNLWSDKLQSGENFKIEMSVRVPGDTSSTKHYLIHALHDWSTITWLYIKEHKLYFYDSASNIDLSTKVWNFITVSIENNWETNQLTAAVDWVSWEITSNISNDIENLYIWALKYWTNYYHQINDIIDYVKIYK